MTSLASDNLDGEEVIIIDGESAQTNLGTFFITAAYMFQYLRNIYNVGAIRRCIVAPLGRLWTDYYPRVAFGYEAAVMPPSTFTFVITSLLSFVEIKSQGNAGFPFHTHPPAIMVSVTSLLLYGLSSAVELVVSAAGLDLTSVYASIVLLGRIGSLCILITSLAALFYF